MLAFSERFGEGARRPFPARGRRRRGRHFGPFLRHVHDHFGVFARVPRERGCRRVPGRFRAHDRHDRRFRVDFEVHGRAVPFGVAEAALLVATAVNVCLPAASALLSVLVDHFPPEAVGARGRHFGPFLGDVYDDFGVFARRSPRTPGIVTFDGVGGAPIDHDRRFGVDFEARRGALAVGVAEAALLGRVGRERVFAGGECFAQSVLVGPFPAGRRRCRRSPLPSRLRTHAPSLPCFRSPSRRTPDVVFFDGDGGSTIVTTGGNVFTSKPDGAALAIRVARPRLSRSRTP